LNAINHGGGILVHPSSPTSTVPIFCPLFCIPGRLWNLYLIGSLSFCDKHQRTMVGHITHLLGFDDLLKGSFQNHKNKNEGSEITFTIKYKSGN